MARQKNFHKIPGHIKIKVASIKTANVRVGSVARLPVAEIAAGHYKHLGITLNNDGKPVFPKSVVPDGSAGRSSDANANGKEIIRHDLPMMHKTFSMEAPNYGDWSNGSHEVEWTKEVYQREFIAPTENEIEIEFVGEEGSPANRIFVFKFTVDQPVAKNSRKQLLRLLNLLQENVGVSDVFDTSATTENYLQTKYVNWEIIPPGERDTIIARIVAGMETDDPKTKKRIGDRYDLLAKMKPHAYIQGHGGFRRYFGAQFAQEVVAFENMEYGNAAYVMVKGWEQASKKTKQELMASGKNGTDFYRVVHGKDWKARLREIIKKNRN